MLTWQKKAWSGPFTTELRPKHASQEKLGLNRHFDKRFRTCSAFNSETFSFREKTFFYYSNPSCKWVDEPPDFLVNAIANDVTILPIQ